MLGICSKDTTFDNDLSLSQISDIHDSDAIMIERQEKRHVVTFSRNFNIDERDYLTMEEVLRDTWLNMRSNGFYYETSLDAVRTLVKTTSQADEENAPSCQYRITSIRLPFVTAIPQAVLKLDSLEVLDLSDNACIEFLPMWIGKLKKLRHLNLSHTKQLRTIPDEIGDLTNLEQIDLVDSGIIVLPDVFHHLQSLKTLDLKNCERLESIPRSIGSLKNLQELDLHSAIKLKRLPEQIGRLRKLNKLNLSYTNLLYLPFSIGKLKSLEELDLSCTKHLETIPEDISKLRNLHRLDLSYSNISSLPDKIGQLQQLDCLNLHQCRKLKRLPESVRSLEKSIAYRNQKKLSSTGNDADATFNAYLRRFLCI